MSCIGHHHLLETRGLCLSEDQTVSTILRRPRIGVGNQIIDLLTRPYRLIRRCEVTAILILFGLSRLLIGSNLAHEMMHAWRHLNGYPNLSLEVEEGICQVLTHMWSSKKGKRSQFVRKFDKFFKHQIESDGSVAYGDGFRRGTNAARQGIVFATAIKSLVVIGPHAYVTETMIRNY
ncbi:hypothetical protein Nepgr_019679 [Nepenthes gracilis]|uniref:Protein DA1-like domain-containing protein n=1 Tax=Nepenthes gracilis TaxID=150966 RepID=A0AAD3STW8_NEPGR|nr:hypothetical protein Nepgr_019679 [Nepenthes gracilis]